MRKHLLGLMLIAGLAGCGSEHDSSLSAASLPDKGAKAGASAPGPLTQASLASSRKSAASFASLPDRGELLSYGGGRKLRQSGAYSYHPVAISEAHALNAIAKGGMVVNLPDGEALRLKYERHEEQPDGNWTWIGRNEDGSSAVLTFGDRAVFGMVSNGADYYRVRTDRTGAWVVETDRSLVAANGGQRQAGPDALLPGGSGLLTSAAAKSLAKAASTSKAAPTEKAAAVVDILVGYSSGLVSQYGSAAAASTFVTSLAALTNAAYANSGVNMRVRVVHTLQVNYGDNTDNQDTLQQMTGYNADTQQPIPVNSAFNALRAARDEYGADLVAFVRRYREPEQDGCGIAWLLGMNRSSVTAADDAEFGYAVVSDGEDTDEGDGNTYFCSDYSLAHELGHLMGQAHNVQDASDGGAHTYSYGYRESSATGFFTIMAYPSGDSQVEIGNFANPSVNVVGRPTGVVNQADNVRSMNIIMPIVATFRATVVPLEGNLAHDFDGDGRSDILWRNTAGNNTVWKGANASSQQHVSSLSVQWSVTGVGDFDGDGRSDILWRNSNGQNAIWRSASAGTSQYISSVGVHWHVAGVGDFNGDGRSDILWRNSAGNNTIWLSANAATQQHVSSLQTSWSPKGIGDFDGDGKSDILWRNAAGNNAIWRSANATTVQYLSSVGSHWAVAGIGDFNGDGRSDVLWRNTAGNNTIWLAGSAANQQYVSSVATYWFVAMVGDFNADGRSDILWRNTTGNNTIWRSGNAATQQHVSSVGTAWSVVSRP